MKGRTLKSLRKKLGWTQVKLSKSVGVTSNTIARWERDEVSISKPVEQLIKSIYALEKAGKESNGL
jgi:transcriptional regulator with XRE-family HTH domain